MQKTTQVSSVWADFAEKSSSSLLKMDSQEVVNEIQGQLVHRILGPSWVRVPHFLDAEERAAVLAQRHRLDLGHGDEGS